MVMIYRLLIFVHISFDLLNTIFLELISSINPNLMTFYFADFVDHLFFVLLEFQLLLFDLELSPFVRPVYFCPIWFWCLWFWGPDHPIPFTVFQSISTCCWLFASTWGWDYTPNTFYHTSCIFCRKSGDGQGLSFFWGNENYN